MDTQCGRMKGAERIECRYQTRRLRCWALRRRSMTALGWCSPVPSGLCSHSATMTLTKILRDNRLADRATVHGFRSSFRIWAEECTSASHAAMELALAHAVGSAVEQAYMRSDLLERRRTLMQQWANYVQQRVVQTT